MSMGREGQAEIQNPKTVDGIDDINNVVLLIL